MTPPLLDAIGLPWRVLECDDPDGGLHVAAEKALDWALDTIGKQGVPTALLVRQNASASMSLPSGQPVCKALMETVWR